MKRIFVSIVVLVFGLALFSCNDNPYDLKISVYLGGYGKAWIEELATKFSNENGKKVVVEANPTLAAEIPNRLQNSTADDIFFSHGIAWESLAVQGYLEPLDDVMEQEVENGIKLKDKVDSQLLSTAYFQDHYYKLPWTNGVGGLIYNAKMFKDNNWKVPSTYDELVSLCETIYNAKIKIDPTDLKPNAKTILPFVWSDQTYYWDYLVFDWWAQLAGVEFFNEYTKVNSAELFNPTTYPAQTKALEAWSDLVAKNPRYSIEGSYGKLYMAAQMDFINGNAAMMPNAQWLESEMIANIDPNVCELAMMPAPFLSDAKKDSEGNPIRVNYAVGAGDSIIVPAKSTHKETAKEFLKFLAKDSSLKFFTERTNGVLLAMDYSNIDFSDSNLSTFSKSVVEIHNNSQKFNLYSSNVLVLDSTLQIEWPPIKQQYYQAIASHYINGDGSEFSISALTEAAYNTIKSNWDSWNS